VEAIEAAGAVAGYASPIGIRRDDVVVVADDLVAASPNLVSGANEAGFHYLNANSGRDYEPDVVTDLTAATEGSPCAECSAPLRLSRGVEVGNIFQLGTRYTEALGATYLDAEGQQRPVVMGSYGIGVGRLLACVAEAYRDDKGLMLPISVAPYALYFVRMVANDAALEAEADRLYESLRAARVEVLYDDRDASAGVKFADADLLGIPLRLTLSSRSVKNGGVELKRREAGAEPRIVPLDQALEAVREEIAALCAEAEAGVVSREF
jgi:prolyl-tRNA synthetase